MLPPRARSLASWRAAVCAGRKRRHHHTPQPQTTSTTATPPRHRHRRLLRTSSAGGLAARGGRSALSTTQHTDTTHHAHQSGAERPTPPLHLHDSARCITARAASAHLRPSFQTALPPPPPPWRCAVVAQQQHPRARPHTRSPHPTTTHPAARTSSHSQRRGAGVRQRLAAAPPRCALPLHASRQRHHSPRTQAQHSTHTPRYTRAPSPSVSPPPTDCVATQARHTHTRILGATPLATDAGTTCARHRVSVPRSSHTTCYRFAAHTQGPTQQLRVETVASHTHTR